MQIKAEAVAKILGGRRVSGGFLCHCPVVAHGKGRGDVHPSLTIADGVRALLYTCHAGCDLRAIRAAIDNLDLTGKPLYASAQNSSSGRATPKTTSAHALALWRGARPVAGTLAETYLRERGFDEPPPATIRFLPRYRYEPQGKSYACMIAAIQAPTREIVAVQLTFLHSAMRESLCTPSSSICKHWKRVRVDYATRATFPGDRRFDRFRRQVVGPDLMRCAGNHLHSRKDAGFDKAPYRVVRDA